MAKWFRETYPNVGAQLGIEYLEILHSEKTKFQKISVLQTTHFGKMLLIDDLVMLTERDEFVYHEMIAHVPINVHPNPQRVLVIGAGDGGTLRELLRHSEVKQLDLVEIDKRVYDVSRKYFPELSSAFDDERVTCYWEDGVSFVKETENEYDIIIVDSTDPFGPGEGLFTTDFYTDCYNRLSSIGILVNQSESPQWTADYVRGINNKLSAIFPVFTFYQAFIPTYPSGHWLFGFASKSLDPIDDQKPNRWTEKNLKTNYYNVDVHRGAFALPNFVRDLMQTEDNAE
jgi:spermidine synthase